MRRTLLALSVLAAAAGPALAQPSPSYAGDPRLRETAGCAAVFMTVGQLAANPQVTGGDPTMSLLAGAFGRSFTVKGRTLYARAAEEARRQRLPPEAAFEAGISYLAEAFVAARGPGQGAQADMTLEAARLLERCVGQFPDDGPETY